MEKVHKNIFLELFTLKRQEMRSQQMLWSALLREVWHQVQSGAHAAEFRLLFSMNQESSFWVCVSDEPLQSIVSGSQDIPAVVVG